MKRRLISLLLAAALLFVSIEVLLSGASAEDGSIKISKSIFPDSDFRDLILDSIDLNEDGMLSDREMKRITWITTGYYFPKNLKGIELFVNLKRLDCSGSEIRELDLSRNTKLQKLDCSDTKLTKLDISKNIKLQELDCSNTRLTKIDIRNNKLLSTLNCKRTKLTKLDIRNNPKLRYLYCDNCLLRKLVFRKNTKLKELSCSKNKLKSINISNCPILKKKYQTNILFDYGKTKLVDGEKILCDVKTDFKPMNYNGISRNPESYKGCKITFKGYVEQVIEKGNQITFLVMRYDDKTYWSKHEYVYCTYEKPKDYSRFVEGDEVGIYGICTGITSYTAVLGNKVTVPSCRIERIEFWPRGVKFDD